MDELLPRDPEAAIYLVLVLIEAAVVLLLSSALWSDGRRRG